MKITDIRTLSLSRAHEPERQWYSATFHVPKADCSICIIETDEGLQGIAEPCAYGVPPAIAARIAELKPALIGRDPRDEDLTPHNEAVRANDIANAGLNCALWDLRGKIAGKPTADLLCALGQSPCAASASTLPRACATTGMTTLSPSSKRQSATPKRASPPTRCASAPTGLGRASPLIAS